MSQVAFKPQRTERGATSPNIAVIDDDADVRHGLQSLLRSVSLDAACYENSSSFFMEFNFNQPACALVDVRLPGESGLTIFRRIASEHPDVPVIMISGHADVPMAVVAMRDGAFDFFEKPFSPQTVLDRVQEAISESRLRRSKNAARHTYDSRFSQLTQREREVLSLVLDNKSNKQVADNLNLSEKTIEYHRANLMKKLNVNSVVELVKLCVDAGWK